MVDILRCEALSYTIIVYLVLQTDLGGGVGDSCLSIYQNNQLDKNQLFQKELFVNKRSFFMILLQN